MSSELRTEQIGASGYLPLAANNFFFLISASAPVDVVFEQRNKGYGATGLTAGYVKGVIEPWDRAVIRGAAGTVVSFFVGTESLNEDVTDFRMQIATIAGTVVTKELPAGTFTTPPTETIAPGDTFTVASDLSRRRMNVIAHPANTGLIWLNVPGTDAGDGIPLVAGGNAEVNGNYSFDVHSDSDNADDQRVCFYVEQI
jgi:hypothetical protein